MPSWAPAVRRSPDELARAKRLLETGSSGFEAIAAEVGYENPAFFRRLFKRCTGLTPGRYRTDVPPDCGRGRPASLGQAGGRVGVSLNGSSWPDRDLTRRRPGS